MANICTNILVLTNTGEESTNKFIERMKKAFDCYYVDRGEAEVEIGFSSRYRFPANELKEITGNIAESEVCIDVLSYDFSNNYARYHQFTDARWKNVWSGKTI